ncbi:uncharacterized protein C8Q71DRAFT_758225 [Rhodofomes roseus]|uniref:Uncharacterized protein n=1 Tax=Rhodofomes roseus TaxID=34475 RepID=A0ABQ8KGS6_9APHY|nr:uncharacterized protein C8Q71DRAFT_758225 [Rhodofomes roseus]KAH9836494.1 hypothetical protein C8Q71DRAFT_758225 [Rhodofomes roseus]
MRVTWLSLFSLATLLAGFASAAPVVVSPVEEGLEAREALDAVSPSLLGRVFLWVTVCPSSSVKASGEDRAVGRCSPSRRYLIGLVRISIRPVACDVS